MQRVPQCDIFIAAAAVADYRPQRQSEQKIKKDRSHLSLELVRNPDILAEVCTLADRPFCVGFAAETEQVAEHAQAKLVAKGADMIAANRVGQPGCGFESDENTLEIFWTGGGTVLPQTSKPEIARQLVELIGQRYKQTGK